MAVKAGKRKVKAKVAPRKVAATFDASIRVMVANVLGLNGPRMKLGDAYRKMVGENVPMSDAMARQRAREVMSFGKSQGIIDGVLAEAGITDEAIAGKLAELLDARKLATMLYREGGKKRCMSVPMPDNTAQLGALELTCKLKGLLKPQEIKMGLMLDMSADELERQLIEADGGVADARATLPESDGVKDDGGNTDK